MCSEQQITAVEVEEHDENIDEGVIQFPYYVSRRSSGRSFRQHERREPNLIRRLLKKSGKSTVHRRSIPQHWFRYLIDLVNTLINTRWKWTLVTLASLFLATWLLFACVWMMISVSNGDIDEVDPSMTPCLSGIEGFAGYMLFSIETQTTIGYGSRVINRNCPEAIIVMCIQIILGSGLCGTLVSIVYAKMIRPHNLSPRTSFSKHAVICQRDGTLCLIFRVRDDCNKFEMKTKVNAYIVQNRVEEPFLKTIKIEPIGILIWPVDIVHKITSSSPFWDLSARDIILKRFELVVTLEGRSATTAQSSKIGTSYMSTEIRWGSRFKPCIKYMKTGYYVDHKFFNDTEEVLTPLCSARRLEEVLCETYFNKGPEGIYTPRTVYSPLLWPEIDETAEESEFINHQDLSSGIGSLKDSMLSPESTRSNKTVSVAAQIHLEPSSYPSKTNVSAPSAIGSDVGTISEHHETDDDSDQSDGPITFVYNDEHDSLCSDSDERDGNNVNEENIVREVDNQSPYARRKPFFGALRTKSSSSSRPESMGKRNSDTLFSNFQSYTTSLFTRQTSKNVTETDL